MGSRFEIQGLQLHPHTAEALSNAGIWRPTAVQRRAIVPILTGKDVLVQSATGTGKTLAYVLPLLQRVVNDSTFRAVIMAPSPELAIQILRCVETFKPPAVRCTGLVGNGNIERQKDRLKKHPHLMVGTPGRVLELWLARKIKTAQVRTLVLDEVDALLEPHNARPLGEICSRPEFTAQLVYASATLGERAHEFAAKYMDPERVSTHLVNSPEEPEYITHYARGAQSTADKEQALLQLLKTERVPQALVFVNKLFSVSHLYNLLQDHHIPCASLSSERTKHTRQQAMTAFRHGALRVLIATDAAARGLDIAGLEWVVHFDLPREPETYLHRSGRVGRAGRRGYSLALVGPRDALALERYASALGILLQPFSERGSKREVR